MKPASREADPDRRAQLEDLIDDGPRGYRVGISFRGASAASSAAMTRDQAEQFVDMFNELMAGSEFSAYWESCLMLDSVQLAELFGTETADRFKRSEQGR